MNVSYEGIGHLAVTMPNTSGQVGKLCKVGPSGKVATCGQNDIIHGMVEAVENGMVAVQIEGFVKATVTGEMPACGYMKLVADGNGGVQLSTNGQNYLVVESDTKTATIVFKL